MTLGQQETFGGLLYKARMMKGYSQRDLSRLVGIDYSYLSKMENDSIDYAPSDNVLGELARYLGIDVSRLGQLAGKIDPKDMKVFTELMKTYPEMPTLLRRMAKDSDLAKRLFRFMRS